MRPVDPIRILRQRSAKTTQKQVAADLGVSAPYLSDVLAGKRDVGPKILERLGLRREIRYLPADER
jgi:transcriptional regulator with XRE-family HTH domain